MPARKFLFMEVQVIRVAGISVIAAPNLNAGSRIASEECDARLAAVGSVRIERLIERGSRKTVCRLNRNRDVSGKMFVRSKNCRTFYQVRINEEVVNAVFGKDLVYS